MPSERVAVTGVTGFIGRFLAQRLIADGYKVRGVARRAMGSVEGPMEVAQVSGVDGSTDWAEALEGIDVVIHLVGRTHRIGETRPGDFVEYRAVNVDGTRRLAEMAAQLGVRRVVFLSSIKVNGEWTSARPFRADDQPAPEDAYGISKWEAEQALAEVAARTSIESVVIRPPMVYGPGAVGNFARLCDAVRRDTILPLRAVNNRRSLVGLDNLVDLVIRCIIHPAAAGQTFLVSDGEDISTPELIRRIGRVLGKRPRLIPVPPAVLRMAGHITGRGAEVARLLGSLQVNIDHTCRTLDWAPKMSVDQGLERALARV